MQLLDGELAGGLEATQRKHWEEGSFDFRGGLGRSGEGASPTPLMQDLAEVAREPHQRLLMQPLFGEMTKWRRSIASTL
eukprot:5142445-Karenia_brevis.AAC.1